MLKATHVDGVYSGDPKKSKRFKLFRQLTLTEAIQRRLGIMDATALALCRENNLSIRVFNLHRPNSIMAAIRGKNIGTLVTP